MSFLEDYFKFVGVITLVAFINFGFFYFRDPTGQQGKKSKYKPNASAPEKEDQVVKIRSLYQMGIPEYHEKPVKLKSLWLYPVRGVKGIKRDFLEITPYGIINDRLWVILDKKKLKPVANHNSHLITFLR